MRRALVLVLLLSAQACGKDNVLDVVIVEPAGDHPLAEAASIRFTAGSHVATAPVVGGHYNFSITLGTSNPPELGTLAVEAFAADGTTLVAHGKTPQIQLAPATGRLFVYLARPGSLGSPAGTDGTSPTTIAARTAHSAVYFPGLGIFLAGGRDARGPLGSVSLWFHYELSETTSAVWLLGAPRTDLAGAFDGTYLEFVGGADAMGKATSLGEIMYPLAVPATETVVPAGFAAGARTQAASAFANDGLLLFGGLDASGAPQAGAVLFLLNSNQERPLTWNGAVPRLGATATTILSGAQVIVFGGGPAGMPVMEKYVTQTSATVVAPDPTTNRRFHTATLRPDGTIFLCGGLDDGGAPLASASVYDPVAGTVQELPSLLQTARSDHTATLAGGDIVIAGGEVGGGQLATTVEVFDATTLAARGAPLPMLVPRSHHTALDPGNDSVVILGGQDQAGAPTGVVEIYQP